MGPATSPFGDVVAPGSPLRSLDDLVPLAALAAGTAWRNEVVLVPLDRRWRSTSALTMITEVPSVPELFETFLDRRDPAGRSVPTLLDMHRVVCIAIGVPYRIGAAFDWFDCDASAVGAGVHLVEWISLEPHHTALPRVAAGVASRWPLPPSAA